MARIIDKVRNKRDEIIAADNAGNPEPGNTNARMAIAAIHDGLGSATWRAYMGQFVDNNNPDQLARLLATDATLNDPVLRKRRAYLVGNAVCATTTDTNLDFTVNSIDDGIAGGAGCSPDANPVAGADMRAGPD